MEWSHISALNFEKFMFHLLELEGFKNRKWFGAGGGDKGRDITCSTYEVLPFGLAYELQWIFQCKRYSKIPTQSVIFNEIVKASEHNVDVWVLVIPLIPPSNFYDFLESKQKSMGIKLLVITKAHLEEQLFKYPELKGVLISNALERSEV